MKHTKEVFKFYIFFFVVAIVLLLTYNLSFYISDLGRIFTNPFKIIFIFIYASVFCLYFSLYIVYTVKRAKILIFFSALCALFYLHEFERNIFYYAINNFYYQYLRFVAHAFGVLAVITALISVYIQYKNIKVPLAEEKKNKNFENSSEGSFFI